MKNWDDSLKIGVEEIDKQHKEIFVKSDKLLSSLKSEDNNLRKESAKELIYHLKEYFEYHFKEEEELQKEIGYPNYEEHKQEHKDFIKKINIITSQLEQKETEFRGIFKLHNKVLTWFVEHMGYEDIKIKEYIDN